MKNKMILTTLLAASLTLGCSMKELLEPTIMDFPAFVIVNGDTVKTREDKTIKDKFKGHPDHTKYVTTGDTVLTYKEPKKIKPAKTVDLSKITNGDRKGQKFRMVVFGGSLGAGVRDGGIFNEAMETSYGSLLANQLGVEFKNPLFDVQDYNGFGRKEPTTFNPTKGPIPKLKNVSNNTGIDATKKEANGNVVLKNTKVDYDNYAFPYSSFVAEGESKYGITNGSVLSPFIKRMNRPNLTAQLKEGKTFDFYLLDIPHYDGNAFPQNEKEYLSYKSIKEYDNANPPYFGPGVVVGGGFYYNNFFKKIERILAKGVILNTPNPFDCPFYQQNYKNQILDFTAKYKINELYWHGGPGGILTVYTKPFSSQNLLLKDIIYGYSGLDSLLSPVVNINLKPGVGENSTVALNTSMNIDLINQRELIRESNLGLVFFAQKQNISIVDIFTIFEAIRKDSYSSLDGVKVTGNWPGGNFFSSDGIHPSAFGQAVITNEIIKVINSHYKMDIPYINTQEYLK